MDKKNVRVFFEKNDRAIYISHLDLMRTMQRALKRSGLPVWYTEGFNPRIYLNFPLALSLGVTGCNEPMDIAVTEDIGFDEIIEKLNSNMPTGIRALKAAYPVYHNKEIGAAEYYTVFSGKALGERLEEFMAQDKIEVMKHSKKKGMIAIDIKPHITILDAEEEKEELKIRLRLPAGLELNLNSAIFTDAFTAYCVNKGFECKLICAKRTNIYCTNGEIFA